MPRMMRTLLVLLVASAASGLPSAGAFAQKAPDTINFRLEWRLTGYHLPFYWAQAQGYYKDANLEVIIKEGSGSGTTINLVGSGQEDLGFADYMLMASAVSKGMKAKAIFGIVQDGAWAVISHTDKPVKKPQDLVGRSVAATPDQKPLLDVFLRANGVDPSSVTVRVTSAATRNTVFDQGQVDALLSITIGSPMDLVVRADEGKSKPLHFMPFAEYGIAPQGQGLLGYTDYVARNPDVVRRFIAATTRAFSEISKPENFDGAIKIAVESSKASPERVPSVRLQWKDTLLHLRTKNNEGKPLGWMSEKDWENTVDILRKTGMVTGEFKMGELYTNEFIPAETN
jgi:NitT/TauT family transport system substrate-binding protein